MTTSACAVRAWLLAGTFAAAATLSAQAPAGQSVFRAVIDLVPVDVRVLDRNDDAVTDLKASDFTLFENGVEQPIRHFSAQALAPTPADLDRPLRSLSPVSPIAPPSRRVFLILLGRGRLQGPSRGLDAVLSLVRERLLPQDAVAVMAWNRATDFTTDHERIATVIERFKQSHEAVEVDLALLYQGLLALYAGGTPIPSGIQSRIDDVFRVPGAGARQVVPSSGTDTTEQLARDQGSVLLAKLVDGSSYRGFNKADNRQADLVASLMSDTTGGASLDEYVSLSRQSLQDVGDIYAAVEYLRFIDGEKHILFVTEDGVQLPRADDDRDIGAMAADARVAIDTLQTGGVSGGPVGFRASALRTLSEVSGGLLSVSEYGTKAINRIVHATDFDYLLGYVPANPTLDRKFRQITVQVNRPGVTLSYRRGYFARPLEPYDPRKSIGTVRMLAASAFPRDIPDLQLSVKVSDVKTRGALSMAVTATIPAERVVLARRPTSYLAALSLVVICTDSRGNNVGDDWRIMDVELPVEQYAEVQEKGLRLSATVPVERAPDWITVIVYDYGSDLLGKIRVRR